jgi:hypothetical protein
MKRASLVALIVVLLALAVTVPALAHMECDSGQAYGAHVAEMSQMGMRQGYSMCAHGMHE